MMKEKPLVLILSTFLALSLLAACQPATEPGAEATEAPTRIEEETPTVEPTNTPETAETDGLPPAAVLEAQQALMEALGINLELIETVNFEQREWPDACLGLAEEGEMCAQVITPGFLVTLEAEGETYRVRSDLEATTIRIEPPDSLPEQVLERLPPAVASAQQQLAEMLGLDPSQIEVLSYEITDWPNGCLGMPEPGEMCADVITPGWLIMARAAGNTYEVRTGRDGSSIRYRATSDRAPEEPAAVSSARLALAGRLAIEPSAVEVVSFESREWRNSCLGLGRPDESCLQAITPGYLVTLSADGRTYRARTDERGSRVRFEAD